MGKENLIQYNGQTPEIARENGRKGGLASGVAKRRRKALCEVLNELLPMEIKDDDLREALLVLLVLAACLLIALRECGIHADDKLRHDECLIADDLRANLLACRDIATCNQAAAILDNHLITRLDG